MKTFAKFKGQLLACVPKKWADFYSNAPKKFGHEYITAANYTREEFLELAEITRFLNFSNYENDISYSVHNDCEYVHKDCESWFLNEKEMALYESMPVKFTQDDLRAKRLLINMPISSQDRMTVGTLFRHVNIPGAISLI